MAYSGSDYEWAHTNERKDLISNTYSEQNLELIRSWVTQCTSQHENCGRGRTRLPYQPSRLLCIGASGDIWRLCITSEEESHSSKKWISLSYQWGKHQQLILTNTNLQELRTDQHISALPKTFRDAVLVARSLGVEYLWIDALCIIQDSPTDWQQESLGMRSVYANSYCTIAADWAPDPTFGLFCERDVDLLRCGHIPTNWMSQSRDLSTVKILVQGTWDFEIKMSPLQSRGWALQERILPPRVIHFTDSQIFWECDTTKSCEAYEKTPFEYISSPDIFGTQQNDRIYAWLIKVHLQEPLSAPKSKMSMSLFRIWTEIASDYSRRNLTVPGDKLVALAGMAGLFQELSSDEYLAGIWRSNIWEGLLWKPRDRNSFVSPIYRAPTWSFAAMNGGVYWPRSIAYTKVTDCHPFTLDDVQIQTNARHGTGSRGQIIAASITVRGYAPYCKLLRDSRRAGKPKVSLLPNISMTPKYFLVGLCTLPQNPS
jgi:hypothetical protein